LKIKNTKRFVRKSKEKWKREICTHKKKLCKWVDFIKQWIKRKKGDKLPKVSNRSMPIIHIITQFSSKDIWVLDLHKQKCNKIKEKKLFNQFRNKIRTKMIKIRKNSIFSNSSSSSSNNYQQIISINNNNKLTIINKITKIILIN